MISDNDLRKVASRKFPTVISSVGGMPGFTDADLAAELLRRREADRWISVSERLPENNGEEYVMCLVEFSLCGVNHNVAYYWFEEKIWLVNGYNKPVKTIRWRKYPFPPEAQDVS